MEISVLLSVYNGEKWIYDSIQSVLNQTFTNFEFIIINDGSTDETKNIIEKFLVQDKRIRLINQPNLGLTPSLNNGLKIAKGKWIARIDCDDIALPERLERQYIYGEKTNACLIGCQSKIIDKNSKTINFVKVPTTHKKLVRNLKSQKKFFSHSSAFFKKEIVIREGGYRRALIKSQDYDLWLRLSEVGTICCINYIGVMIREHEDRISSSSFGLEQRIYAHCANISYLIRNKERHINDPLEGANNLLLEEFIKFVTDKLEKKSILDFYKKLYLYKKKKFKNNFNKNCKLIIIICSDIKFIYFLINWLIFGDFISQTIYKEWAMRKNIQTL